MKVICAGLQKTGTKSMAHALRILGYNVHDVYQQFMYQRELWEKVFKNIATQEDFERYLGDVDAVTDLAATAMWEEILTAFPDAKVILMVRSNEDEWYESVKKHVETANRTYRFRSETLVHTLGRLLYPLLYELFKFSRRFFTASTGIEDLSGDLSETVLRTRYRQHNLYIQTTCPKEKLLVYNVKDGWEPLCSFLGVEIPDQPFPLKNVNGSILRNIRQLKYEDDCGFGKLSKRLFWQRLAMVSTVVALCLGFCFTLLT